VGRGVQLPDEVLAIVAGVLDGFYLPPVNEPSDHHGAAVGVFQRSPIIKHGPHQAGLFQTELNVRRLDVNDDPGDTELGGAGVGLYRSQESRVFLRVQATERQPQYD
jgi:hypothetical protein